MNWKPSEGLKRADAVVRDMEAAQTAIFGPSGGFAPIFRHRIMQLIAEAIDQALSDGSEQDAIAAMTRAGLGNGAAKTSWAGNDYSVAEPVSHTTSAESLAQGGFAHSVSFPPTADPVGVDLPDFPATPIEVVSDRDEPTTVRYGAATAEVRAGDLVTLDARDGLVTVTPLKKRGRPKGSTNKAKKKAKAAKAKAVAAPDEGVPEARPEDAAS